MPVRVTMSNHRGRALTENVTCRRNACLGLQTLAFLQLGSGRTYLAWS
jgi:hypothetical protein